MDKLKFALVSIVTLSLLGGAGYWAITTIQSGSEYVNNQKIKKLQTENEALKIQTDQLSAQLSNIEALQNSVPKPVDTVIPNPTPVKKVVAPATSTKKVIKKSSTKNKTPIKTTKKQ